MAIWDWLNGKKTNIGAGATALFALLTVVGVKIPPQTQQTVLTVIGAVCALGIGHKAVKAQTNE